jgi:acyl-CoA reductase-like NAD-dependent aldehyde dehydrogenase
VLLSRVDSVDEAFDRVNASRYELQAALFTTDVTLAFPAAARLQVSGVIVGNVPSYRADQMPYGG